MAVFPYNIYSKQLCVYSEPPRVKCFLDNFLLGLMPQMSFKYLLRNETENAAHIEAQTAGEQMQNK